MTKTTEPVIVQPPAKLNLGLRVLRRRADGYHDLLTTFLAVDWTDRLKIVPAVGRGGREPALDSMTCSVPTIPVDERNLCIKAVRALRSWAVESGTVPEATTDAFIDAASVAALVPLQIDLEKRIPAGAGLGGGSSDAAAALKVAAEIWGLDVPDNALRRIAVGLGADVPFFLDPTPKLATGIGDRLRPLTARPGLPMEHILIAVPDVSVPTVDAYAGITPRPPDDDSGGGHSVPESDGRRLAAAFISTDPAVWRRDMVNDFEAWAFERHPEIGRLKDEMFAGGALYASMSGSGSSVFSIFQCESDAEALETSIGNRSGLRVWRGRGLL